MVHTVIDDNVKSSIGTIGWHGNFSTRGVIKNFGYYIQCVPFKMYGLLSYDM